MTTLTVEQVKPKLESFKVWLAARGAELLNPVSAFELLRFKTDKGLSVFYFKKNGAITPYGEAETAWNAFRKNATWRAYPRERRKLNRIEVATIRKRDGDLCFYCQEYVHPKDESIEHLVALTHGGPDHISNSFLAHKDCNQRADHLSAPEKIKIHTAAIQNKQTRK